MRNWRKLLKSEDFWAIASLWLIGLSLAGMALYATFFGDVDQVYQERFGGESEL